MRARHNFLVAPLPGAMGVYVCAWLVTTGGPSRKGLIRSVFGLADKNTILLGKRLAERLRFGGGLDRTGSLHAATCQWLDFYR
jgi:hypothetical protein